MATHHDEEPMARTDEDFRDREEVDDPAAVAACPQAERDAEAKGEKPIPWAEARRTLCV